MRPLEVEAPATPFLPRRAVVRLLLISLGFGTAAFAIHGTTHSLPGYSYSFWLARRSFLLAVPALFAGNKPADASYAMTQAAEQSHSWAATGREKEMATYTRIQDTIDEKRRFRDEDEGSFGIAGQSDHTNYRRGDARVAFDEQKKKAQQDNVLFTSETSLFSHLDTVDNPR